MGLRRVRFAIAKKKLLAQLRRWQAISEIKFETVLG